MIGQVARLLDTYFSGINTHDGQQAASVFAADGAVNPNDSAEVERFAEGISTSTDDRIEVLSIRPKRFAGRPGQYVHVRFRSRQDSSLGPNGESCTHWDLYYKMINHGSHLLLLGATNVSNRGC
jgi:hypothetical protein